jgi:hypothetical protein
MKTLHQLMMKDTDYEGVLHRKQDPSNVKELMEYCNAVDHVVKVWKDGIEAHGVEDAFEVSQEVFGSLIGVRMLIIDLEGYSPSVSLIEATKMLSDLKCKMLPMVKSYARTPTLAQWYMTIGNVIDMSYRNIRRDVNGGK